MILSSSISLFLSLFSKDHRVHIDHKTDVFFDGFQRLALCAETVIYTLLSDFPDTAIVFLEFQTAILNRKTAQLLHMGVAQHYQVPVISYADTMFPSLLRLAKLLEPYNYSLPVDNSHLQLPPYPHGCSECQDQHIINQFRDKGCKSVCVFLQRSGFASPPCDVAPNVQPCYTSFLAHDAVHPSARGHGMAKDLLAHLFARTARDACRGELPRSSEAMPPYTGWLVAHPEQLRATHSDFVVVYDTMEVFAHQNPLRSSNHSSGFALKGDQFAARKGWISTTAGEYIVFDVQLPQAPCYAIVVSVLHSYETVGAFSATVEDLATAQRAPTIHHDCIWKPHISIPADVQVTRDGSSDCTGHCRVTITTQPAKPGRKGNTIKITSLAARKCISMDGGGSTKNSVPSRPKL